MQTKKEIAIKKLEEMQLQYIPKIEKKEAELRKLKDEQGQIIETLAKLKWRKEVTLL